MLREKQSPNYSKELLIIRKCISSVTKREEKKQKLFETCFLAGIRHLADLYLYLHTGKLYLVIPLKKCSKQLFIPSKKCIFTPNIPLNKCSTV